ncbi:S-layer homology domain-containing protein [Planomicrobium sp. YIM 101495]|uniref:S-layer homology domain-containing protein n=1 Tax=Planomicrobium sp. YIM 101495 TaxID=2665160 RepID=UPI0012B74F85|nr:S-layer homology domain-containing protein [Planomicrobium sp. YIM 101495]MTD30139.1 MBL fold metallo-hydrolase [Planomicrobium sp. YIM 101495]
MKKIVLLALAAILVFSLMPLKNVEAAVYSDVPNSHRFYDDVTYLLENGVVGKHTHFGVNKLITREEAAVMIAKSLGLDGKPTNTKFKDVNASSPWSGYINSAVQAGIISGYPDGSYKPKEIVTRGQMAIFLSRAFNLTQESSKTFKDISPNMAAYPYIKRIVAANITVGNLDGTYKPNDKLTKGQLTAFLARALVIQETGNKQAKVHFINVGQGDSILIQSGNGKNMLIDGGTKSQGAKVVSFLKSKGVTKLDVVVATHPDADHIGGLISVLNNFSVGKFIDSGKAHTTDTYLELLQLIDAKNIPFEVPKAGQNLAFDNVMDVQVLNAAPNASDNNDASLVLRAKYGKVSFLLTGDAGTSIENAMTTKYEVKSTYLKAGHHGSNTSSSATFINAVRPAGTVLSYGKDNSYGHPHKEVLTRLNNVKSKVYSTALAGDITVTTDGNSHSTTAKQMVIETPKPAPAPKPTPKPTPKPPAPDFGSGLYVIPGAPTSFKNCTEMRKYYPIGVKQGHPAYQSKHDRDKDGWACEA